MLPIHIEVKLFFYFAKFLPADEKNKTATLALQDGITVQALIDKLGLPRHIPKAILVNGIKAGYDTCLKNHDSVAIFPPMAGG